MNWSDFFNKKAERCKELNLAEKIIKKDESFFYKYFNQQYIISFEYKEGFLKTLTVYIEFIDVYIFIDKLGKIHFGQNSLRLDTDTELSFNDANCELVNNFFEAFLENTLLIILVKYKNSDIEANFEYLFQNEKEREKLVFLSFEQLDLPLGDNILNRLSKWYVEVFKKSEITEEQYEINKGQLRRISD
jgi:hypothetical protein